MHGNMSGGHDVLYRWKLLIIKIHYAVNLMWKVLELVGKASNYMNKARMLFHL